MRPRVFPAEDILVRADDAEHAVASMRPRVFPAEDLEAEAELDPGPMHASMRPRVFPAEDALVRRQAPGPHLRFNEAAGIPPRKTAARLG